MNTKNPLELFTTNSFQSVLVKFAIIIALFLLAACMQSNEHLFY